MKKRYISAAVLILGMAFLAACQGITDSKDETTLPSYASVTDDSNDSSDDGNGGGNGSSGVVYQWEEQAEDPVTQKWIMQQYGFTEEDLKGIDVEKVAWALWWTRESVVEQYGDDAKMLLAEMQRTQETLEASLGGAQAGGEDASSGSAAQDGAENDSIWAGKAPSSMPDFDTLTKITYKATGQYHKGTEMIVGYLDIENKKIYYCNCENVESLEDADLSKSENAEEYDLTDEEIENIISSIHREYLSNEYTGFDEVWKVSFEFEDGSSYSFPIRDANWDRAKLTMINTFFDKMENRQNHLGFFEEWYVMEQE